MGDISIKMHLYVQLMTLSLLNKIPFCESKASTFNMSFQNTPFSTSAGFQPQTYCECW